MLQSEAGYIDARPQSRQIDETLLQRTAGPYIGSFATSACFEDVRFAPDSDREAGMTKSTLRAIERTRYRGNALRANRRVGQGLRSS
jgi:hypothetical protein